MATDNFHLAHKLEEDLKSLSSMCVTDILYICAFLTFHIHTVSKLHREHTHTLHNYQIIMVVPILISSGRRGNGTTDFILSTRKHGKINK